jgi:hypothetical protein
MARKKEISSNEFGKEMAMASPGLAVNNGEEGEVKRDWI